MYAAEAKNAKAKSATPQILHLLTALSDKQSEKPLRSPTVTSSSGGDGGETDSGKSSCSPVLLDCSVDSGIIVEFKDMGPQKRIQQCQRILKALERDQEIYRILRERLSKISERRNRKKITVKEAEPFCNVCCTELNLSDSKCYVSCCTCNKAVCRSIKCADWLPKPALWECQLCHNSKESLAKTSTWVADQMSFNEQKLVYPLRARSEIYIPINDFNDSCMQFESVSQIGINGTAITSDQKLKIREYVEEIVAGLLGGSLDKIAVGKLSKSENYLPGIINGATQPANSKTNRQHDFSDISEARLRKLIETIIAETLRLPLLTNAVSELSLNTRETLPLTNGNVGRHRSQHYFEPRIYQELLATAVLNKIIGEHGNARLLSESTPDLNAANNQQELDANFNVENQSSTSCSSVEPRSDFSYSDTEQNNIIKGEEILSPLGSKRNLEYVIGRESALSDYIASHTVPLPDLSAPETDEDEQGSLSSSTVGEGTWEDNWLFKKKHSSLNASTITSTGGMLVPAPKEDIRAQIGDKGADEVSDLSELGSESDDSSLDLMRRQTDPLNNRLLSKHLIGGENTKMVLDELIERASLVSNASTAEQNDNYIETKNEDVVDTAARSEAINSQICEPILKIQPLSDQLSSDSNHTDDSAATYIEHYDDPLIPSANNTTVTNSNTNLLTNGSNPSASTTSLRSISPLWGEYVADEDGDIVDPFKRFQPGSIAEREYKKWNNAVEMPNNPYAPEALKRRISGSGLERFIDLPNISPTTEQNPLALLKADRSEEEENKLQEKPRYSRDYYINQEAGVPGTHAQISDEPSVDNVVINEVIAPGLHTSSHVETPQSDCHWTLSTPVRRSSSLKFINKGHKQHNSLAYSPSITPYSSHCETRSVVAGDDNEDTRSQRSWKSASAHNAIKSSSLPPKRNTFSSLSFNSSGSGSGGSSSAQRHSLSHANILSQFEKQLLHKDLKRNSFRAISATTKDFVINPLFERDHCFPVVAEPQAKLSLKSDAADHSVEDPVDSGIDSCLNGFSEQDVKHSSLLF